MESNYLNQLQEVLDNENNDSIMSLTSQKISEYKNNILQKLNQPKNKLIEFNKKLKGYRYVDELQHLKYGSYIKWISLVDPEKIKLTQGGVLLEVLLNNNGISLIIKLFNKVRISIDFDKCLVFQKITNQEKIILHALDYLNKD
jgi:hypothetical protein